jgi:NADH-quinone oxidoreductase subunit E
MGLMKGIAPGRRPVSFTNLTEVTMMSTTVARPEAAIHVSRKERAPANSFSSKFDRVCEVLDKHKCNPHKLIAILQEIQEEYAYLPEEIMTYISTALGISPSSVYGVATFYSHFTLEPKGKYIIKVCDGTACHVKKSEDILEVLERELGLNATKKTTPDMLFTLETAACLGVCGIAPAVVVNEEVHGAMNREKTLALLEDIRKQENGDGVQG